jgi:UDP-glucose 4-epimerase
MLAVVTGGAGLVGSNLVDALVARGDEVVVVDDLSTGKRENMHPGFVELDIRSPELSDVFADAQPEVCFHSPHMRTFRPRCSDPTSMRR